MTGRQPMSTVRHMLELDAYTEKTCAACARSNGPARPYPTKRSRPGSIPGGTTNELPRPQPRKLRRSCSSEAISDIERVCHFLRVRNPRAAARPWSAIRGLDVGMISMGTNGWRGRPLMVFALQGPSFGTRLGRCPRLHRHRCGTGLPDWLARLRDPVFHNSAACPHLPNDPGRPAGSAATTSIRSPDIRRCRRRGNRSDDRS